MSEAAPKDFHLIVFLNASGEKMQTSWAVNDPNDPVENFSLGYAIGRAEQKIRSGTYGSMTGLTFVEHQFRNAEWRGARVRRLAEATA